MKLLSFRNKFSKKHFSKNESPQELFSRDTLLSMMEKNGSVLEIGPFASPVCRGNNVKYFDVLNKDDLIKRAHVYGLPTDAIPDIDFVSPNGDLGIVQEKFDACLSSHCIEHQPDLIEHLRQVERILKKEGKYLLVIPDKRYCFDHFQNDTTLAEILGAIGRKRHTLTSVIEHRALTTHNDAIRHWAGDHGEPAYVSNPDSAHYAINEFNNANGGYIDVHAWKFTPDTFSHCIKHLSTLNYINFEIETISETQMHNFEFYAALKIKENKIQE